MTVMTDEDPQSDLEEKLLPQWGQSAEGAQILKKNASTVEQLCIDIFQYRYIASDALTPEELIHEHCC